MASASRSEQILHQLTLRDRVRVADLAAHLDVSEITVRRDLELLERDGALRRVRGGAISLLRDGHELPYDIRRTSGEHVRQALAIAALDFVRSADTIAVDSGTTGTAIAQQIGSADADVLALSLHALEALHHAGARRILLPGGQARPVEGSIAGPLTIETLRLVRFDLAFVTCCAIDSRGGICAHNLDDAAVKRTLLEQADRVVLVTESAKFDRRAPARVGDLSHVDVIVTDIGTGPAADALIETAATAGTTVIRVDPDA